ncbi:FAD-dependent oxidoreductase [Actimicrobium antarcticum]|uniref:FAD-dependent oxidoreductase n=1 Tax=Actimicrobium antarcticum TaxID=1051899 RepID=A0ABP7TG76_9BURK
MNASQKRLLLIGGGHSHLFVLEALRKQPSAARAQLDVTLLSSDLDTPYSGMLPGLVAGHYRSSECHVDLRALAAEAGVHLLPATVERLDLTRNCAYSATDSWSFDVVSLDIGSTPPVNSIPGARGLGLTVKPIDRFLQQWAGLQSHVDALARPIHLVMVGGGAGGVELVLAMAHRLQAHRHQVKWSLVSRGDLLPGYPRRAARLMAQRLAAAGIAIRTGSAIVRAEADRIYFADGSQAACDQVLWATGSAAQSWPGAAGLACVDDGFISVNAHLQSVSHPHVFAAGDIATDTTQPRPKAGVFAVRQGPVLADNLLRYASGQPLLQYRAQRDYLSLLSTGGRHAIGCWYGLVWQGDWVWQWKNRIDRKFMARFSAPFEANRITPPASL